MNIIIQPDPENIDFIRANPKAQELANELLRAFNIFNSDCKSLEIAHDVELDPSLPLFFEDMQCFLPESLNEVDCWFYSIQFWNGAQLIKLNDIPFWASTNNTGGLGHLPEQLLNLSFKGWPLQSLSSPYVNYKFDRFLHKIFNFFPLYFLKTYLLKQQDLPRYDLNIWPIHLDFYPFQKFANLKSLDLSYSTTLYDITTLLNFKSLIALRLKNCPCIVDIKVLKFLTKLKNLDLSGCRSLTDIQPLEKLGQLISFDLGNCETLTCISAIAKLSRLTSLNLSGCKSLTDISCLFHLENLKSLNLSNCTEVREFFFNPVCQLESLDISGCNYFGDTYNLFMLNNLVFLNMRNCSSLKDVFGLNVLEKLTSIDMLGCESIASLDGINKLDNLKFIGISRCAVLKDISALVFHTQLTEIDLSYCTSLTDIRPLASLEKLNSLKLVGCESLTDIMPLSSLTNLISLDLSGCESLTDIRPLASLEKLCTLKLSSCKSLSDIAPLAMLKNLRLINLDYCENLTNISVLDTMLQLEEIKFDCCNRITYRAQFKGLNRLEYIWANMHPTTVADILAHCALSRKDWAFINQNADDWLTELQSALKDSHPAAFDLATSLAIAFPHISFELSERLCQILQTDPSLDYRPWKQLFLGVFQEMGFNFLQNLASTIAAGSWPRGAIGGLSAIAEQLITLADGKEWFAGWVLATSAQHESNPSFLKPVAAPWCLALHCLGENELLDQWIARFTDPDDSTAIDAVFLEFGNHRLGHNDAPGAFRHAMRIRATLVRDGLLADIASHHLEAQQADQAAELLFLLSAEDKRAELSLKLAGIPHFLDNRDNLHRLLAACGKNAPAIGKLLAKAGMDEAVFPSDADDERQRAAQDAAQMASIRTGLDAAYVGKLFNFITQLLKNKAYTP